MVDVLTRDELKKILDEGKVERGEVILVDVRMPEHYLKEHIPGAINIPLHRLRKSLGKLRRSRPVIVYCDSFDCKLSMTAYRKLKRIDYNVKDYEGGISDWKEGGYPVEGIS